jgi:hypothetical protein
MLLNQLNFNFLKIILVILFVQINPAIGKEKLNLTYDNIKVFLEGNFVQGGLVIGKSDPKIEIKLKRVVLPAPFGPIRAVIDDFLISNETFLMA